MPSVAHRSRKGLNIRAENSHQPTRQRERAMKGFRSTGGAERFLSAFSGISPHFRPHRHLMTASDRRAEMTIRFAIWDQITGAARDLSKTPEDQVSALARRATKRPTLVFKTPQLVRTGQPAGCPSRAKTPGLPTQITLLFRGLPSPRAPRVASVAPFRVGMGPIVSGAPTEVTGQALFGCL